MRTWDGTRRKSPQRFFGGVDVAAPTEPEDLDDVEYYGDPPKPKAGCGCKGKPHG